MLITFPHMGNAHIPIKALLQGLKLEVVPPPPITKRTLELGVKYSPEFACLPLKINVGNFIEALELGADTVLMAGGWGPCRFGYYAQIERDIIRDLGYEFDMIILEAPDFRISDLLKQIKALGENVSVRGLLQAVSYAWLKVNAVEKLERKFEYILPRTIDKDEAEKVYDKALIALDNARNKKALLQEAEYWTNRLESLPQASERILQIGLVGEIYTILEPACNCNIVRYLGRLNVQVTRAIYLSEWINDHLLGGLIKKSNHRHIVNCAYPYLSYWVGGHGQETVGYSVDFARKKYDGIIQIGPMTCMPEIVAHSILSRVSEKENIHCMTIYFDEQSGSAGVHTRLEAFTDMLRRQLKDRKVV
ncbi:MAG: CoA protein activase [Syntrophomonadaceae bacterium]